MNGDSLPGPRPDRLIFESRKVGVREAMMNQGSRSFSCVCAPETDIPSEYVAVVIQDEDLDDSKAAEGTICVQGLGERVVCVRIYDVVGVGGGSTKDEGMRFSMLDLSSSMDVLLFPLGLTASESSI